jgi:L-threonylcarbamoyladenylate synthase
LGCDPWDIDAIQRLLDVKRRPPAKGLIVIAANWDQVYRLVAPLPREIEVDVACVWPGPVTFTLPAKDGAPHWLFGKFNNIAIRMIAHPIAAALCLAADMPLVSTSANRHGQPAARSALDVRLKLPGAVDALVAGPTGGRVRPSEVRDPFTQHIFRQG